MSPVLTPRDTGVTFNTDKNQRYLLMFETACVLPLKTALGHAFSQFIS